MAKKRSKRKPAKSKKKQPLFLRAFKGFFWLLWIVLKYSALGVFHLFRGSAKLAAKGVRKGSERAAKSAEKKKASELEKNTVPASYSELVVSETIKGEFKGFEHRLNNDSLIIALAGRRAAGKSALGFRLLENVYATGTRFLSGFDRTDPF